MSYSEQPLFIPGDAPIYGVFTQAAEQKSAFLVITGFGEEKKSVYRNVVDLCRHAAAKGITSLRFDLSGTGDSDADISKLSVDDWFRDIKRAYHFLVEQAGTNCSIVGLRLGCLLAINAALDPVSYVFIAPPQSGALYLREELMRRQLRAAMCGLPREANSVFEEHIAKEGSADLDGINISFALYDGIRSLNWDAASGVSLPCLIVHAGKLEAAPSELLQIAKKYQSSPSLVGLKTMQFWNTTDYTPLQSLSECVTDFFGSLKKNE